MRPVRHSEADVCYHGPTPEIGDLWCMRERPGAIIVVYELDDADRELIAAGGQIMLGIQTEPIPPISMQVIGEPRFQPIAEHRFKDIPELDDPERNPAARAGERCNICGEPATRILAPGAALCADHFAAFEQWRAQRGI